VYRARSLFLNTSYTKGMFVKHYSGISLKLLVVGSFFIASVTFAAVEVFETSEVNIIYAANPSAPYGINATKQAQPFQYILLHHTGGNVSLESAVRYGQTVDKVRGGSFGYHFYIGPNGRIAQGAPLSRRTNHVKSRAFRRGPLGLQNFNAIGVSVVSSGSYTGAQVESLTKIVRALQKTYDIPNERIFGHGEVQSNRGNEMKTVAEFLRGSQYQGQSVQDLIDSGVLNATTASGNNSFLGRFSSFLGISNNNNSVNRNIIPEVPTNFGRNNSILNSFFGVPQTTQSPYCLTQTPSANSLQNTIGSSLISSFFGVPPTQQNLGCLPQISSFASGSGGAPNSSSGNSSENSKKDDTDGINKFSLDSAVDSLISTQPTSNTSIKNATPTLLCLPDPVSAGEDAIIMWACRDGAYTTQGENFDTGEKMIGSTIVSPNEDTLYSVTCINKEEAENTSASCEINVANPALALVTTPTSVKRGEKVSITWRTNDIKSCALTSKAFPSFEKNGIEGEVVSPRLTTHTVFTLSCETDTGQLEEKKVSVFVQQ